MEAEDVINLFDSCWFQHCFFMKTPDYPTQSNLLPDDQFHIQADSSKDPEISAQLTLHTRSKSEQTISPKTSMNFGAFSPDSVLPAPHLETILSGIEGEAEGYHQLETTHQTRRGFFKTDEKKKKEKRIQKRKGLSKSLSELEFEELKGFMDLGFVFSEEDKKDSTLVEIIPGLQRLGKERNGEKKEKKVSTNEAQEEASSSVVARRPYLSEAWEVLNRRKEKNPLMNWKVPQERNEIVMKDTLKRWAHIVASTV
ncbi:OLC1v1021256C1 [Oldenlandia corymbosa var. corymbosa]|uniref:OLC1v1021256C1 n=1 Tax=Oldenlandia corymbosa var. corymbosa TaxID=529605 RepID=A0AAV1BVW2_OLDCO|nr:OLC1v1021256C1 [Oldenlandia corymbosa var. corymbosa]